MRINLSWAIMAVLFGKSVYGLKNELERDKCLRFPGSGANIFYSGGGWWFISAHHHGEDKECAALIYQELANLYS